MIETILIANRGEIAIRIAKAAKQLNIKTVMLFAADDAYAEHIKNGNEKARLKGNTLAETYLNIEQIIAIAKEHNADAIHPGYGFLSENVDFVNACDKAGITFIGPSAAAMQIMGDKIRSREFARNAGVPLLKGAEGSIEEIVALKSSLEYPVIIKPSAGGGGKGMRIIDNAEELEEGLNNTAREALSYFGDATVFVERYIKNPRHIEVQILGDIHGNIIHLYERECTIQRRHQKVIEEAPSITLDNTFRKNICESAVSLAKAANYYSAGTVEYIMDEDDRFYFMEMNTRIQVEHPVTEMITGVDIVKEQIKIAQGESLQYKQSDIKINGHSIECRIYAEEPIEDFRPSPGEITFFSHKMLDNGRLDSAIPNEINSAKRPYKISATYDPMIAKSIVHAASRKEAIDNSINQLNAFALAGIPNNIGYLTTLLGHSNYQANTISTNFIKEKHANLLDVAQKKKISNIPKAIAIYINNELGGTATTSIWEYIGKKKVTSLHLMVNEENFAISNIQWNKNELSFGLNNKIVSPQSNNSNGLYYAVNAAEAIVAMDGEIYAIERKGVLNRDINYASNELLQGGDAVVAPIPGTIIQLHCKVGDTVTFGQPLIVLEAMKMENALKAPRDGIVMSIHVEQGKKVDAGNILIALEQ